jgi:cell division protein FtsB
MINFQQKRGWRNIVHSKPFLVLFGIGILFFAWSVFGFWNRMQDTEKNKKIIEDKVALLKKQKENISSEINNLNTVEGKEKFFRENLGLAKEGEGLTVVVEDKNSPAVSKPAYSGFWLFLTSWFK